MRTVTEYECDFCHHRYNTDTECIACEDKHEAVDKVIGFSYIPFLSGPECKYPLAVRVQMADGEELVFKR